MAYHRLSLLTPGYGQGKAGKIYDSPMGSKAAKSLAVILGIFLMPRTHNGIA